MKVSRSRTSQIVSSLRNSGCVFAEDEAERLVATSRTLDELIDMVNRRVAGLPLEYILGWAEFYGQKIMLEPGVFVPRRRTEFLAQQAIAVAQPSDSVIVDLCCGSGAVGIAVITALDRGVLYAVDIEPSAVRCARRNVADRGRVFLGDLYDALPSELQGRVDILVANAPYVPTDAIPTMPQEARLYEPLLALDGGKDGLDVQRRVIADAPLWLAPGGKLLIETSARQATQTADMYEQYGVVPQMVSSADLDATVVIGTKSP